MYRKRRSSGFGIGRLILLGIVFGVAFVAYDSWRNTQDSNDSAIQDIIPPGSDLASNTDTQSVTVADESGDPQTPLDQQTLIEARIVIPEVGISAQITTAFLDGVSWDVSRLGNNVGHLQGTAWLDDPVGNIVLSGHVELSDGRQGVFEPIDELRAGNLILITQGDEERTYMVTDVFEVSPEDLEPLYPTNFERLTLITCGGYDFFSDTYQVRTVVIADRLS